MAVRVESEQRRTRCLCGAKLTYDDSDVIYKPELRGIGHIVCPKCNLNLYVSTNKKPSTQQGD